MSNCEQTCAHNASYNLGYIVLRPTFVRGEMTAHLRQQESYAVTAQKRIHMQGPYGFELAENCSTCKLRANGFFCQLPSQALQELDKARSPATYPAGAVLFIEKQKNRGVYILCEGQAKLSISSSDGKKLILRIAKAGEVLGLMALLAGSDYDVTAEMLHSSQVVFIPADEFHLLLAQHPEAQQNMLKQLTQEYRSACEHLRLVGLSASPSYRLARLLLTWSAGGTQTKTGVQFTMSLTHEEIAECIGFTRETVSRTLREFRNKKLVALRGSTMVIPSRYALENVMST